MGFDVLLLVLAGALAVTALARKIGFPAPLAVTAVAAAVSFIPNIPAEIDSEVILTLILPPLLYSASLDITFQDFRISLRQIRRLGIGLVVVTALVVGGVANVLIGDISIAAALLLGAIVAPPDAVSASAIGKQLGLPRRIMSVLSGESLINDAAALTLFTLFLNGAVKGANFGIGEGIVLLLVNIVVGVAIGLAIAVVVQFVRVRIRDPLIETVIGLLVPFAAYLIAEHLGGSGVLAVVSAGLYLGYNAPKGSYVMRLQEQPIWATIDVLLEAFVFALIGLQLASVLNSTIHGSRGLGPSLGIAFVILGLCIAVRFIYVFATYYVREIPPFKRWSNRKSKTPEPKMSWRDLTVISWAGMRGVVTLASAAAALSWPGLPAGDLILLSAFVVTVGTLLIQGLTLPWLIKRLQVVDPSQARKDMEAERELIHRTYRLAVERMAPKWEALREKFGDKQTEQIIARLKNSSMTRLRMIQDDSNPENAVVPSDSSNTEIESNTETSANLGSSPASENTGPAQLGRGVALSDNSRLSLRTGLNKISDRPTKEAMYKQKVKQGALITKLRRELNDARRKVLIEERDQGRVDEEAMRTVLMELDTEEFALDQSWMSRMRS